MATLFDSLQKKLNGDDEENTLAPEQGSLAAALTAKGGKAGAATGPAASTVGESTATAAGTSALDQGRQTGQLMGAQVGAQAGAEAAAAKTAAAGSAAAQREQAQTLATQAAGAQATVTQGEQQATSQINAKESLNVDQINAKADDTIRQLAADKSMSVDNIWREFTASSQDLAFRKDAAKIEEIGFTMAMRDKAYVDELNRIGAERQLTDKLNFQDESNRIQMGDALDQTMGQIQFKEALNADQRAWDIKLAQMSDEAAVMLAQAAISDAGKNQEISGAGEVMKAGINYYYNPNRDRSTTESADPGVQENMATSPYNPVTPASNNSVKAQPNDYVTAQSGEGGGS